MLDLAVVHLARFFRKLAADILGILGQVFAQAISSFVFKQPTSRREAIGIVLVVIGVALLIVGR